MSEIWIIFVLLMSFVHNSISQSQDSEGNSPLYFGSVYTSESALRADHQDARYWSHIADPNCNRVIRVFSNAFPPINKDDPDIPLQYEQLKGQLSDDIKTIVEKQTCPNLHLMLSEFFQHKLNPQAEQTNPVVDTSASQPAGANLRKGRGEFESADDITNHVLFVTDIAKKVLPKSNQQPQEGAVAVFTVREELKKLESKSDKEQEEFINKYLSATPINIHTLQPATEDPMSIKAFDVLKRLNLSDGPYSMFCVWKEKEQVYAKVIKVAAQAKTCEKGGYNGKSNGNAKPVDTNDALIILNAAELESQAHPNVIE